LDALKNSRRKKDAEKERLKKETERLRNVIISQAQSYHEEGKQNPPFLHEFL